MRRCLLLGTCLAGTLHAAEFASFRYDDDFVARKDRDDAYSQLKYVPLGDAGAYLGLGGDLRERAEFYSRSNIGAVAVDDDAFLLHRLLLHADLRGEQWRLFAQLGNHESFGREPQPKPTDVDHLDTRQAFVDYRFNTGADTVTVRAGRQEMAFGASRLITARDGPNIRLAFDGLRVDSVDASWTTTLIAVRPAENVPSRFDDGTVDAQSLWGVHATWRFAAAWRADLYYFGTAMDALRYDSVCGDEDRDTVGARIYGRSDHWDSDVELMLQGGDIGGRDVRAFALATDNGWTLRDWRWQPRLGLRTDIISGDRDRNDDRLGTFNALYPNGSYFSEATVLAQANLLDFAMSLTLKPRANVSIAWAVNPLWRYSTDDALYTLPLAPLIAGNASDARYIGVQQQLIATWQVNDFVALRLALVHFDAGTFVTQGGGHDLDYAQFATNIRF